MNDKKIENIFKNEGIALNSVHIAQLNSLMELTLEKNKVMNLTSITDVDDFIIKMLFDSGVIKKYFDLSSLNVLDVGTGAGFPSLVLSILFPLSNIYPLDSNSKKINHIKEVKDNIGLNNVFPLCERVEDYAKKNREKYDVVTARAVSNLSILLEISAPLVKVDGYFISYKGSSYLEELNQSKNALKELNLVLERVEEFYLPFINEKRAILFFKKIAKTDNKYPRLYNKIKNKPL
ncbi:MAG: 16S rRNA (guanine(527)-N(7))-methyltransferase RsmG [Bacilli bacterium]